MNNSSLPLSRSSASAPLLTAAYYASFIILGLAVAVEGPSLPTLAAHTSSPLDRISLMFVTGALGYVLGSLLGGRLYDRLPGHRMMSASLAVMLLSALVYPAASALAVLLVAAFVMGLGKGALDVGCNTLLQWVHGAGSGPYLNGLHFAFGLGSFLSPVLLAQVLARTGDIYWVFWTVAIVIFPLVVWLWLLPEPPVPAHAAEPSEGAAPVLPVALAVLAFFLYVGAEAGFANWLYTYAITLKLADTIQAAYLTSAFWAFFTAGRLLAVWIASRARPRTILYVDFVGSLVSVALIGLMGKSVPMLWLGSIGLGLSLASIFPTILLLAGEQLLVTGTITGWFLLGAGAGGMLLPWLIGNAFTSIGPRAMIGLVFLDLVLNVFVLLFFMHGIRARESSALVASRE